jgi:hypothetical protein
VPGRRPVSPAPRLLGRHGYDTSSTWDRSKTTGTGLPKMLISILIRPRELLFETIVGSQHGAGQRAVPGTFRFILSFPAQSYGCGPATPQ